MDGDGNGSEGGNFVFDFPVQTCDPGPRVTSPELGSRTEVTGGMFGQNLELILRVEFDRPILTSSLKPGTNFFLQVPALGISHVPGTVVWDTDRQGLTFTTEESVLEYCDPDISSDCVSIFRLVLNPDVDGSV